MKCYLLFAALCMTKPAFAGEPMLEISQTVYAYSRSTVDEKPQGGDVETIENEGFQSMPADLEISVTVDRWIFSVFPTTPGAAFEISYMVGRHLEVGVNLGYNYAAGDTDTGSKTTASFAFGPRTQYTLNLDKKDAIEFENRLGFARESSAEEVDATASEKASTTRTKETTYEVEAVATYERVVTDNLRVATGIGYTFGKGHEEVEKLNATSGELELEVLQFRYGFY